jgi:hypothetical protein
VAVAARKLWLFEPSIDRAAHTARIGLLREVFPEARFVPTLRDHHAVVRSIRPTTQTRVGVPTA